MVNKHLLSLLAFMLLANMSFAQMNVQGTITEAESGEPLPGVSVVLKGTTQGTVTDVDGNYTIEVPSSQSILVFSSVGYVSEEIVVNNRSTIDVSMIADITTLGEVVVMGYNTVRRSDLAGAVSVVDPKEFGDIAVSNTQQLLQGKVAGVQVLNQSGLPGDPSRIIVRGTGTFTDTDPLYVIDGIQANANAFNSISPADIKEVTVLKDASSTAIYGAQGANGVVIVTTKKGETGKPQIRYDGYVGFAEPWNKFDMMNANQYIDLVEDIAATQNTELTPKLLTDEVRRDVTDWQDEMYQSNAPITEHRLSVSGGNEKVTYMVSGAYLNQEATIKSRTFERYNLRFSLQENVGKRFKFGQNVNIRFQNKTGQTADLIGGLRMPPYSPVLDPSNLGGYAKVTTIEDLNDAFNPMTEVNLRSIEDRNYYALIQLFGEVEIIDGLKFKSQFQTSYDFSQRYDYEEENANGNLVNPSFLQEYYGYSIGAPMFENFLTYNKTFANKHSINVMVGNTIRKGGNFRNITINGSDFPNDDIKQIGVATEVSLFGASAGFGTSNLLSYFAQLGYVYDDRFVFTFNFRRDGSPAFGEENRFGNFPSLGASWNIHEEQFMANQGIFSTLKLRASWGKVGNANIGLFRTDPTVWSGESQNIVYSLGPDKTYINGATINSLPNPELKW
jgi:TonB-linked SusC/RagA family outer membrane protein